MCRVVVTSCLVVVVVLALWTNVAQCGKLGEQRPLCGQAAAGALSTPDVMRLSSPSRWKVIDDAKDTIHVVPQSRDLHLASTLGVDKGFFVMLALQLTVLEPVSLLTNMALRQHCPTTYAFVIGPTAQRRPTGVCQTVTGPGAAAALALDSTNA